MSFWENHVLPRLIDCACSAGQVMKIRAGIVPQAEGHVLEVGCGTGTNFGFYDPARVTRLTAVEPAEAMRERARKALAGKPLAGVGEVVGAGGEAIPLPDGCVDTAVVTYVLCTIPDPLAALAQVRRVLKPDGRVIFAEHGIAPDAGVARWQARWEPWQKRLGGGCHVTRDPLAMLRAAGFAAGDDTQQFYMKGAPKLLGFTSVGMARPA